MEDISVCRITVQSKRYGSREVIVDAEDYEKVMRYHWFLLGGHTYAEPTAVVANITRNGKRTLLLLHYLIFGETKNKSVIDHINSNPLDNRKSNLQEISQKNNIRKQKKHKDNTSGIRGISWHKRDKKWYARIGVDGKVINLGSFSNIQEAEQAYKDAAEKYFGQFTGPVET